MLIKVSPLVLALALCVHPARAQQTTPPPEEPAAQAGASDDPDAASTAGAKVPLEEIRRYVMVYNAIRQAYVDPVDDKALMDSAVRGLLLDLDPHSAYLPKVDAEQFDEQTRGAYDGVGVELQQLPDGALRVIAPLDDSPAERAGLRSGDRIIAIDGKPLTAGNSDASAPLRGKAGTRVVVTVQRDGRADPFDLTLARETIRTASVRSRLLAPGFDCIVDAVDSTNIKALIIAKARQLNIPVVVSGSAGGRRDPTQIKGADLGQAGADPLLQQVRRRLREEHGFPKSPEGRVMHWDVPCVYSTEKALYPQADGSCSTQREQGTEAGLRLDCSAGFGAATFVTGTFGFALAAEVLRVLVAAELPSPAR